MSKNSVTSLKRLLVQPQIINCKNDCHRQLAAAKLRDDVELRLRLASVETEGDGDEWEEHRKKLGRGLVVCPNQEIDDDHDNSCTLCAGAGMIPRARWEDWFFSEKGCREYAPGCAQTCKLQRCPHDAARIDLGIAVLVLEASKKGSWVDRGNSLDGFKLAGLCANLPALARYLDLVCEATGVAQGEE